ncbi:DUF5329 family protein [Adhaeribacter terreus]|uniref:DUF5329 family protein n=1 Tax=Adhaeribacter terreus TaxID=529703 RepID=A0ABW0EG67_9BACT
MKKIVFFTFLLLSFGFAEGALAQSAANAATPKPVTKTISEEEKINRLIKYVAGLQGATFIRNGDEYPAKAAAEHLQMKRRKAGNRVKTAREFIDGLASESYLSGEAYQIRLKDGKTYKSRDVLMKELQRIEKM